MNVTFYDDPPEARSGRVWQLVEAAWQRSRTLLIHCPDAQVASAVDAMLWTADEASFVPHEIVAAGAAPADAEARVILVTAEHDPIHADILLQIAPTSLDFASGYRFVIELVDRRTPETLATSRERYTAWRERGVTPDYRKR